MSSTDEPVCGPDELLEKLLENRDALRGQNPSIYGNLSDAAVRRLVKLAYHASQAVEEGRYPRFRLYVAPSRENLPPDNKDSWRILHLAEPVTVSCVDDLRRLAPAASSHDFGVEVAADPTDASRAVCVGICLAHSGDAATGVFGPSIWARAVRPGLMIRVDGPGELRVSEARRAFDLRSGRVRDLGSGPLHLYEKWKAGMVGRIPASDQHLFSHLLHFAWHEILHLASQRRHGACFIVLSDIAPSSAEVETRYGIQIKYKVQGPSLGERLKAFIEICSHCSTAETTGKLNDLGEKWIWQRHSLLSNVECLATISAVDGCVVFDGNLRLLGFGGKIIAPGPLPNRRREDFMTHQPLDELEMSRTGTRHLSALKFCDAATDVASYVISQDGHATVFWSDQNVVWRYAPYWPWIKTSDQF